MLKLIMLIAALMLCVPAMGEEASLLPVKLIDPELTAIPMEDAVSTAQMLVHDIPVERSVRAEMTELTDGRTAWVVTTLDTSRLVYIWTAMVDAETGDVLQAEVSDDGYLKHMYLAWTEQKGPHALWSLEDKALYDALYAMMPAYGLPETGDMSAEEALQKALAALGLDSTGGYEVGYGYLMGGEGCSGVWEISLVIDGQVDCQVNLDAVNGAVYYLRRNNVTSDEANG